MPKASKNENNKFRFGKAIFLSCQLLLEILLGGARRSLFWYSSHEAYVLFCLCESWRTRFVTWGFILFFSFYGNDLG